jgi:hypothetical protein
MTNPFSLLTFDFTSESSGPDPTPSSHPPPGTTKTPTLQQPENAKWGRSVKPFVREITAAAGNPSERKLICAKYFGHLKEGKAGAELPEAVGTARTNLVEYPTIGNMREMLVTIEQTEKLSPYYARTHYWDLQHNDLEQMLQRMMTAKGSAGIKEDS